MRLHWVPIEKNAARRIRVFHWSLSRPPLNPVFSELVDRRSPVHRGQTAFRTCLHFVLEVVTAMRAKAFHSPLLGPALNPAMRPDCERWPPDWEQHHELRRQSAKTD